MFLDRLTRPSSFLSLSVCCGGYASLPSVKFVKIIILVLTSISNRSDLEVSRLLPFTLTGMSSFNTALISCFLLGFSEAAFFPGAVLLLSTW